MEKQIIEVCRAFGIEGDFVEYHVFTDGHINCTYAATFNRDGETEKYLVQAISTVAFKNPAELMENIVGVTEYLRKKIAENGGNPERETLTFLKNKEGEYHHYVGDMCWRIYNFIDNSYTISKIESPEIFENAGRTFGLFQKNLDGFGGKLHETIKDFHNTPKRFEALVASYDADVVGRAAEVREEYDFALARKEDTGVLIKLHEQGLIPMRVTHNDTKLNNILFDENTGEGVCVIDLDTIMPGFSLYDFGDAIRFGANTTREDDDNLDNVQVSLELFAAFARGFLSACAKELTPAEVEHLAFSAKLMTYECGIRFLKDYLDGDVYFKINKDIPTHNLIRARNQFKLVTEMEKHMDEMKAIVAEIYEEYK